MDWLKKAIVLFYLGAVIGASWVQLALYFGIPAPAGIILTPSDMPYMPPLSVVFLVPTDTCQGWSLYYQHGRLFGVLDIQIPTIHYFDSGYMVFNYYVITGNLVADVVNYFKALLFPDIVIVKADSVQCTERVVAYIPGYFTVVLMLVATPIRLVYKFRRVW
jgi:hypothetical protein